MNIEIKNVTVCGSGVLGGQIAFQTAFHSFNVLLYDINEELLEKAKVKLKVLAESYKKDLGATQIEIDRALTKIAYTKDLNEATKDADLVIEAITENLQIKKDFYTQLGKVASKKAIFCTNTSTLLPSTFANETGRPNLFLALHFANNIWLQNTAEIMGHSGTDPEIFDTIVEFAKAIGMVALPIRKEQPGYILNSLLVPLLSSALDLYVNDVAGPQTIDKTWMIASGAPMGPFATFDVVGINTAYNIAKMQADAGSKTAKKAIKILEEEFISKGKLGISTGEGFYKYPNPAYESPDFLK